MRPAVWNFSVMFAFVVSALTISHGFGPAFASQTEASGAQSESRLTDNEISRRNREVLRTLLENANKDSEKQADRRPAVIGPPVLEEQLNSSVSGEWTDEVHAQPQESDESPNTVGTPEAPDQI